MEGAIGAATVFGALHGLESLAQAVGTAGRIQNAPLRVRDEPRFGARSLLVDTSRHFLPVDFLKHVLDGMAHLKLNLLHWHIVDSNSFPCGSEVFPELAQKGAWSYPDAAYTVEDLKDVVRYALDRGVRVMPEVSTCGRRAGSGGGLTKKNSLTFPGTARGTGRSPTSRPPAARTCWTRPTTPCTSS